jgi:hypothetical protein
MKGRSKMKRYLLHNFVVEENSGFTNNLVLIFRFANDYTMDNYLILYHTYIPLCVGNAIGTATPRIFTTFRHDMLNDIYIET